MWPPTPGCRFSPSARASPGASAIRPSEKQYARTLVLFSVFGPAFALVLGPVLGPIIEIRTVAMISSYRIESHTYVRAPTRRGYWHRSIRGATRGACECALGDAPSACAIGEGHRRAPPACARRIQLTQRGPLGLLSSSSGSLASGSSPGQGT